MNFQGTLTTLVGAFIVFYLSCLRIGRPDIPMKIVTELRVRALDMGTESWGCPSLFNKDICHKYDSRKHLRIKKAYVNGTAKTLVL